MRKDGKHRKESEKQMVDARRCDVRRAHCIPAPTNALSVSFTRPYIGEVALLIMDEVLDERPSFFRGGREGAGGSGNQQQQQQRGYCHRDCGPGEHGRAAAAATNGEHRCLRIPADGSDVLRSM